MLGRIAGRDLGFDRRTTQQIHSKIKDLRRSFKLIHDSVGRSGNGADLTNLEVVYFRFYRRFKRYISAINLRLNVRQRET